MAMFGGDSLCGAAFRYARWLRETGQWNAMDHFTTVIHPAVGRLAGRSRTRLADLTPLIVAWSYREAARHGITSAEVTAAWAGFGAFLAREGIDPALPGPDTAPGEETEGRGAAS